MLDFLKEFEQNPNAETLDKLWRIAATHNLHQGVMTFGQLALNFRQLQNKPIFPDCQELLSKMGISGFYTNDPADYELGRWANELLYLNSSVSESIRNTARRNHVFYTKKLKELADSVKFQKLKYNDLLWNATNPSIVQWKDLLWMIQRTVNYNLLPDGSYDTGNHTPIQTKNYLVQLDLNLNVVAYHPIADPVDWPDGIYKLVLGFEDCRPFVWNNQLHCSMTIREQNPHGFCEIWMMTIADAETDTPKFVDAKQIKGLNTHRHEKNWMPMTPTVRPTWVYTTDPTIIINSEGRVVSVKQNPISAENFRGGGQVIVFQDSLLAIIHESVDMVGGLRQYVHRFVSFGRDLKINGISERFKFLDSRIEFAAGLTTHPITDDVIVSFGVNDSESWLCTISKQQVQNMLKPVV